MLTKGHQKMNKCNVKLCHA